MIDPAVKRKLGRALAQAGYLLLTIKVKENVQDPSDQVWLWAREIHPPEHPVIQKEIDDLLKANPDGTEVLLPRSGSESK